MSAGDPRAAFRDAIRQAGLMPPEGIQPDGKLHRFASNGRRGDDSGWYIFHDDGIPAGCFGDWRTDSSQTWRADVGRDLTPAELAAHQARVDAARRARDAEEARRRAAAAKTAGEIWNAAQSAPGDHSYLVRKRIEAHGLRLYHGSLVVAGMPCDGSLIVPACDGNGTIHTLELISTETRGGDNKRFLPGGDYRGRYFSIGTMEGAGPLCVSEGYATLRCQWARGIGCATTGDRYSLLGDWPDRVRKAFALLAKPDDAARSRSEMLLGDFRDLFAKHGDRILSAAAVGYLVEMEERPWPEYSRGKPITARQVAAALRRFEIKPVLGRVGTEVGRGYVKDHFINAFKRYLPPEDPPSDPLQRYNVGGARLSEDLDPLQVEEGVTDRKSPQAKQDAGCNDVTDRDPRIQSRVEVEV